ncbi:MAG: class I SAM-dependent methyltransferase [Gammaproteobacteria bacterium]|jgi:2-polyprenyl-3-methyl-5-hydroxy-6-metoxy-1,4-benzoquinol methylase
MERRPEPELMLEPAQARAYAEADFEAPHNAFVETFRMRFPNFAASGHVLDLGCGPGDISRRFALAYPGCEVEGIDGSQVMIDAGREQLEAAGVTEQVRLHCARLPEEPPPRERYDALISNSLLHHLHEPAVLWNAVLRYAVPDAPVFVMDLMRPQDIQTAQSLMEQYAAGEPEVLRHDFYHSLLAAFRPEEVREQIDRAGLEGLEVEVISDRHLIVWGRVSG